MRSKGGSRLTALLLENFAHERRHRHLRWRIAANFAHEIPHGSAGSLRLCENKGDAAVLIAGAAVPRIVRDAGKIVAIFNGDVRARAGQQDDVSGATPQRTGPEPLHSPLEVN